MPNLPIEFGKAKAVIVDRDHYNNLKDCLRFFMQDMELIAKGKVDNPKRFAKQTLNGVYMIIDLKPK